MTSPALEPIRQALASDGPAAAADALVKTLRERGDYDRLFDALLIQSRVKLGVPVVKPTSFDDVPADKQDAFEEAYLAAAREVGTLLLQSGKLARAWAYFRTIREPQPVADALAAIDPTNLDYDRTNELIEIALHDGANRVAGLRILLASHGTCNTVTMTDQVLPMMTPDERRQAAALLVRDVYDGLVGNLKRDVESRLAGVEAPNTIRELIAGRDFLFENGNYHIDVSHLHSTVRFARALTPADPELALAIELAEYGSKLDRQFRYPADPPFDEYYEAHLAYLKAVGDVDRDASLGYFRNRLNADQDERDRQIIAYVLVDLLTRCDRLDEAAEVAAEHLADLEEPGGFSFSSLCGKAGRIDLLRTAAEKADDPVRYAAAVIAESHRD
jgi:hypothetical protein